MIVGMIYCLIGIMKEEHQVVNTKDLKVYYVIERLQSVDVSVLLRERERETIMISCSN